MKKIELTKGQYALIDDEDYQRVSKYKWYAGYCQDTKGYYARRTALDGNRKYPILLHRFLMNPPADMQVDHINHDTLDNRKSNLRICTRSENQRNRRKNSGCNSFGVTKRKSGKNRFQAQLNVNGNNVYLGVFPTEELASEKSKNYQIKHNKE